MSPITIAISATVVALGIAPQDDVVRESVDLIELNKINNVHTLRRFHVGAFEIFVFEHDEFSFFVFVTLDDLIPRHLLAVGLSDAFVINGTEIAGAQQPEFEFFTPRRRVQSDRDVDQAETD